MTLIHATCVPKGFRGKKRELAEILGKPSPLREQDESERSAEPLPVSLASPSEFLLAEQLLSAQSKINVRFAAPAWSPETQHG